MELGLDGKVALVTGGMHGIGRAIADALIAEGCKVQIADLNVESMETPGECVPQRVEHLRLDVGNPSQARRLVDEIADRCGRIDILVNCAGILKTDSIVKSTISDWDAVVRVNLSGVFYCSKAVLQHMVSRRYGKIINIASVSAVKGGGEFGNVLYGATKAGVVALTRGFARELGPHGINVNAISPGVVETPMTSNLMIPEVRQRVVDAIPIKRLILVSEVARLALFLSSDLSSGITGQVIALDGGFLVR